jgi:hypothetical protein
VVVPLLIRKVSSSNSSSSPASNAGGEDNRSVEIVLAGWVDRFVAWLIDFIIVSIGLGVLFVLLAIPFWSSYYSNDMAVWQCVKTLNRLTIFCQALHSLDIGLTLSTSGQSIGKRLLNIKTTDMSGKNVDTKSAALERPGKSFILPIDVILGWLFANNKRQRIFNKISNTIVIS